MIKERRGRQMEVNNKLNITPVVGLRLQDVVIRANCINPRLVDLRNKVNSPGSVANYNERLAVLNELSQVIFGSDLNESLTEARDILAPYHFDGKTRRTLVISSASSASASQETECSILNARGHIIDIPGAIEGRDTRSANGGDVALISTKDGLLMAKAKKDVDVINLADEIVADSGSTTIRGSDIYYKADALLLLILNNPNSKVLTKLVETMKTKPLIFPYNLDEETQLCLLWLAKRSGIKQVDVNANSPEVAVELTRKGYRYPLIEEAIRLPNYDNPIKMQREEWKLSQAAKEIGYHPDIVPGYVIKRAGKYEDFRTGIIQALALLKNRYGLDIAWVKPDRGTDGGSQGSINMNDCDLTGHIQEMWEKGGDWVIEAKTNYFHIKLSMDGVESTLATTPSVHVIKGIPRQTVSIQLVDGVAWGGNLICSQNTWIKLMDLIDKNDPRIRSNPRIIDQLKGIYGSIPKAMHDYVEAINNSKKYRNGQVRGGADMAIATLGGKFGKDNIVVAVQDYNARANGCETAYALYDQAQELYGRKGEAITRNITPRANFNTFSSELPKIVTTVNALYRTNINPNQVKLIAVSAGWGQIGMIGTDPMQITRAILLIESQMRKLDLVK